MTGGEAGKGKVKREQVEDRINEYVKGEKIYHRTK